MNVTRFNVAFGMLVVVGLAACAEDKAKPDFDKCIAFEAKGDVLKASEACESATKLEPESKSGKAAAQKLKDLEPAVKQAKVAEQKAWSERRAAEQKAQAARLATALGSATIERESWSDGSCLAAGLPPKAYRFAATPADADLIASAGGCRRRHEISSLEQCCPADFDRTMRSLSR